MESTNAATKEGENSQHNPYFFPEVFLSSGQTFNGSFIFRFPTKTDALGFVKEIRDFPLKDDDVILTGYPKSGTHWMSEILSMLLRGSTNYIQETKEHLLLEFANNLSDLNTLPSPRLLNTHLPMAHFPQDAIDKKVKIVHMVRNPKDVVVSFYHMATHIGTQEFTMDRFIQGYLTENYMSFPHQFDYLKQLSDYTKSHPDHPIKHVYYEDLKKDPVGVIQDVAQFLGLPASTEFCENVAEACRFNKLKTADLAREWPKHLHSTYSGALPIFRKGEVGDWKNWLTVAQNETLDGFIAEQADKGLEFTFKGL